MSRNIRSLLHVVIQFAAIFYLVFSGPNFASSIGIVFECVGFALGIWSVYVMRKSAFSVFPDPEPNIRLIIKGPYKLIRHPMYLALFLVLIPLVITFPTLSRIVAVIIFTINQILKISYEEKILLSKVPGYKDYMKNTKGIIPYVF